MGTLNDQIERATVDDFLALYNAMHETSFDVIEHGDAPDFRCESTDGSVLNIEVTLTQDRPSDIKARLGRLSFPTSMTHQ